MTTFRKFMKQNKEVKSNTTYAATQSLKDENGETLLWVIKPLNTKENMAMIDSCTVEGERGVKFDRSKYILKLMCASVVAPNLYDKDLQDSYGVLTPEDLIQEMLDDPNEYAGLYKFIQEYNTFDKSFEEKVDEAKK